MIFAGADPGFFLGGGALVSCATSTPINHIVFHFLQNTSCIRKPQVISRGGGGRVRTPCTLPLDPPLICTVANTYSHLMTAPFKAKWRKVFLLPWWHFRYAHSTECSRIPHLFDTTCMHQICIFIGLNDEEHYMRLAFYQGANSIQLIMTLKQYRISELND